MDGSFVIYIGVSHILTVLLCVSVIGRSRTGPNWWKWLLINRLLSKRLCFNLWLQHQTFSTENRLHSYWITYTVFLMHMMKWKKKESVLRNPIVTSSYFKRGSKAVRIIGRYYGMKPTVEVVMAWWDENMPRHWRWMTISPHGKHFKALHAFL